MKSTAEGILASIFDGFRWVWDASWEGNLAKIEQKLSPFSASETYNYTASLVHWPLLSTWRLNGASEAAIFPTACPAEKNVVTISTRRVLEVV